MTERLFLRKKAKTASFPPNFVLTESACAPEDVRHHSPPAVNGIPRAQSGHSDGVQSWLGRLMSRSR